jgi:hypothetical protein
MDASGNLNIDKLAKELASNLQAYIKYKQTDNMKKRAIKTAGSYDQFKAMVDCAGLKTLKTKEIEGLKDIRKVGTWLSVNTYVGIQLSLTVAAMVPIFIIGLHPDYCVHGLYSVLKLKFCWPRTLS